MKVDHLESEGCSFLPGSLSGVVGLYILKQLKNKSVCLSVREKRRLMGFSAADMPFKVTMNFNGSSTCLGRFSSIIGLA